MGRMKDLYIDIHNGGDAAIVAANKLAAASAGGSKFLCYSGWLAAIIALCIAFMCELGREMAVDNEGLLRATLGSCRARLEAMESRRDE